MRTLIRLASSSTTGRNAQVFRDVADSSLRACDGFVDFDLELVIGGLAFPGLGIACLSIQKWPSTFLSGPFLDWFSITALFDASPVGFSTFQSISEDW